MNPGRFDAPASGCANPLRQSRGAGASEQGKSLASSGMTGAPPQPPLGRASPDLQSWGQRKEKRPGRKERLAPCEPKSFSE